MSHTYSSLRLSKQTSLCPFHRETEVPGIGKGHVSTAAGGRARAAGTSCQSYHAGCPAAASREALPLILDVVGVPPFYLISSFKTFKS